jgi:hypothetical protein
MPSYCNQIGGVTVAMYTATTILGALEGLVLGYAARPAWQPKPAESDALPPIRIEPSAVTWDAMSRVSVVNSGHEYARVDIVLRPLKQTAPLLFVFKQLINLVWFP